ncbi:non-ribosomal peptide synthetase [Thalassomonas viridans]|uniref:Non-ribosomal peptide synthetase n=1 Tax=Thalassomonas viridans TaxID=137584 RepID=A0AAF0CEK0_9GAMM|nr:non-ribosomal peptide synthetase [Thalassomonas viridans]WDE09255.1 non-ribosomal peptide synthetase [Thalassomonas viridans]
MSILPILDQLTARKVIIKKNQQKLNVDAPANALNPELVAALKNHKPRLMAMLEHSELSGFLQQTSPAAGRYEFRPEQLKLLDALAKPSSCHLGQYHLLAFTLRQQQSQAAIAEKLSQVIRHADALRLAVTRVEDGYRGEYLPLDDNFLRQVISTDEGRPDLTQLQQQLSAATFGGQPLFRLVVYPRAQQLTLVFALHVLQADVPALALFRQRISSVFSGLEQPVSPSTAESHWALAQEEALPADGESRWRAHQGQAGNLTPASAPPPAKSCRVDLDLDASGLKQQLEQAKTSLQQFAAAIVSHTVRQVNGCEEVMLYQYGKARKLPFHSVDFRHTAAALDFGYPLCLSAPPASSLSGQLQQLKQKKAQQPQDGAALSHWLQQESSFAIAGNCIKLSCSDLTEAYAEVSLAEQHLAEADSLVLPYLPATTLDCRLSERQLSFVVSGFGLDAAQFERELEQAARQMISLLSAGPQLAWYTSDLDVSLTQQQLTRVISQYNQVEAIHRITPLQHGMYFHSLLDNNAYTINTSLDIVGDFDVARFRRAAARLVAGHSALRTRFSDINSETIHQIILTAGEIPVDEYDLSARAPAQQDEAFADIIRDLPPFNLADGPLLRFTSGKLKEQTHRINLAFHHIILDGWSVPLLIERVLQLYHQDTGSAVETAAPASLYVRWLEQQDAGSAGKYWSAQLAEIDEPTKINIELPPSNKTGQKISQTLTFDQEQSRAINRLAHQHKTTLNVVLQAAWGYLLHRYSGAQTVVFGSTTSGRPSQIPGIESMVGMFMNTVPVAMTIRPQLTLSQWLAELHQAHIDRESHSYLPLNKITELSGLDNGIPLFDSLLVVENMPRPGSGGDGRQALRLENYTMEEDSHYPITLDVVNSTHISITIKFDDEKYLKRDFDRLIGGFKTIICAMVEAPGQTLAEIDIISEADRRQLSQWHQQGTLEIPDLCPHQLISEQARLRPAATALVCNDRHLSYAELESQSNRLADYLLQQTSGERQDSLIALMIPRSIELVTSILAVWKTGSGYIPIDPELPAERIDAILQDADADILLCSPQQQDKLGRLNWQGQIAELDPQIVHDEQYNSRLPDRQVPPDALSYVIFTSGSTGRPKGAQIEHVGALNHMLNKVIDLQIDENSRVVQNASQSFDISVWQMFCALISGGTTYIYDQQKVLDIRRFIDSINDDAITILEVVPSYMGLLLDTLPQDRQHFEQLKFLMVTGETVDAHTINRWFGSFPAIPVFNAYGPTEASDDITHHLMTGGEQINPVPIGKVLKNFNIHIVDEQLRELPVGVKGEILVTGIGVGRGYINDPEKTALAFGSGGFTDRYKGRYYKTGDIGRFRPDGVVEFFGRKDKQVKVHGHRIELEEIEGQLQSIPGVKGAVVLDCRSEQGNTFLCAHIQSDRTLDGDFLTGELRKTLPFYMLPSHYLSHRQFPLNNSGKVDRGALRSIEIVHSQDFEQVKAATETEQELLDTWCQVLDNREIGVTDNYFRIGGDSFKAIQIAAKYGRGLTVVHLYDYPSVRELARFLDSQGEQLQQQLLTKLVEQPGETRLTVIGVPNSAGNPVSFLDTARAVAGLSDEIDFYGMTLPRNPVGSAGEMTEEISRLADEIAGWAGREISTPLVIYGQCNGSAMAIAIANRLEQSGIEVRGLVIGGALQRIRHNRDDERSDEQIIDFLRSLGAPLTDNAAELNFFLQEFKYDVHLAQVFYNNQLAQINARQQQVLDAPVYCVTGTQDKLTAGYQRKYKYWLQICKSVHLIEYPGAGHYLLRDCPQQLAETLVAIYQNTLDAAQSSQNLSAKDKLLMAIGK